MHTCCCSWAGRQELMEMCYWCTSCINFHHRGWGSEQSPRLGRQGLLTAVALAIVLSSSRVQLEEKAGYWQAAKPWEWWCGLTQAASKAPNRHLLIPPPSGT